MGKEKPEPQPESGPINLKRLSEILRLSQTTISLVLNDSPAARSIPTRTRERVFEAARKFQYRPNYFARSLRRSRSMSVGVIAPDLSEGYFTLVMQGVEECLLRAHYFYFAASHYWKPELMEQYPRMLTERAVDGFLLLNTPAEVHNPLPTVAISAHNNAPGVTNIVLDHKKAASLALSHLHQLGHRRIAFMKGPEIIPDTEYRWRGILQMARKLGIEVHPELCIQLAADSWSPQVGYEPMSELLARTRDFTAIFCFNDISAIGVIRAIHDAGLRVALGEDKCFAPGRGAAIENAASLPRDFRDELRAFILDANAAVAKSRRRRNISGNNDARAAHHCAVFKGDACRREFGQFHLGANAQG